MRRLALMAMCIVIGAAVSAQGQPTQTTPAKRSIPAWKINDLLQFLAAEKKPVIVNLWATFCQPCVEEIPYFQMGLETEGAGKVDLLLLSMDLKEAYPDKIAVFALKHHFHARIAWLNETDADAYGPKIDSSWTGALPSSVFYNPLTGYRKFYQQQLTRPQFQEALKELLR